VDAETLDVEERHAAFGSGGFHGNFSSALSDRL